MLGVVGALCCESQRDVPPPFSVTQCGGSSATAPSTTYATSIVFLLDADGKQEAQVQASSAGVIVRNVQEFSGCADDARNTDLSGRCLVVGAYRESPRELGLEPGPIDPSQHPRPIPFPRRIAWYVGAQEVWAEWEDAEPPRRIRDFLQPPRHSDARVTCEHVRVSSPCPTQTASVSLACSDGKDRAILKVANGPSVSSTLHHVTVDDCTMRAAFDLSAYVFACAGRYTEPWAWLLSEAAMFKVHDGRKDLFTITSTADMTQFTAFDAPPDAPTVDDRVDFIAVAIDMVGGKTKSRLFAKKIDDSFLRLRAVRTSTFVDAKVEDVGEPLRVTYSRNAGLIAYSATRDAAKPRITACDGTLAELQLLRLHPERGSATPKVVLAKEVAESSGHRNTVLAIRSTDATLALAIHDPWGKDPKNSVSWLAELPSSIRSVNAIAGDSKGILMGTNDGLWHYSRTAGFCVVESGFENVHHIARTDPTTLLIAGTTRTTGTGVFSWVHER